MTENMRLWLLAVVLGIAIMSIGLLGTALNSPDGTESCQLVPGSSCYHLFLSTETTTTADSGLYQVDKCPVISYKLDDASGAASIFVKECSEPSISGDCAVFVCDFNADGIIDAIDEGTVLDGTSGTRSCTRRPTSRWHWIDVQTVPSSGDARVSVLCHSK